MTIQKGSEIIGNTRWIYEKSRHSPADILVRIATLEDNFRDKVVVPEEEWNKREEKWLKIKTLLGTNESYTEYLKRKYHWIQSDNSFRVFENRLYDVGKPTKFKDMDDDLQEINSICEVRHSDVADKISRLLEIEEVLKELMKDG